MVVSCNQLTIYQLYFLFKASATCKIAYLDKKLWSLAYHSQNTISRVKILKIIDYQIFIVIYFEGHKTLTSIIWFDQMSLAEWKKLKTFKNSINC